LGPSTVDFSVHEQLICTHSPFFANALNGSWAEADSRVVPLPDDAPPTFAVYRTWLYTGLLACTNGSDSDEWELLACAYVLGEKLQDSDFKDTVIDAMVEKFNKYHPMVAVDRSLDIPVSVNRGELRDAYLNPTWSTTGPVPQIVHDANAPTAAALVELAEKEYFKRNPAVLIHIYENTPPNAPVRRLLVDHYCASGKSDWIGAEKRDLLPEDFLYALSFQFMTIKEKEEGGDKSRKLAPYQCESSCNYHEHGEKMCYRFRKFPWVA
jgi:hypothetical protein